MPLCRRAPQAQSGTGDTSSGGFSPETQCQKCLHITHRRQNDSLLCRGHLQKTAAIGNLCTEHCNCDESGSCDDPSENGKIGKLLFFFLLRFRFRRRRFLFLPGRFAGCVFPADETMKKPDNTGYGKNQQNIDFITGPPSCFRGKAAPISLPR